MEAAEVAAPERRCETKRGHNSPLACASPRNFRRSRRRSELLVETKEDKEPNVVLVEEKKQFRSSVTCYLSILRSNVFSVISDLRLLFLRVSFLSNTLRQRLSEQKRRELQLSEEDLVRIARRMLPITKLVISKTNELFSGELAMTLKVAPFVLIGAEFGYLITFWRLSAFGFFLISSVPKLYSSYASQIHQKVESSQKRIVETWAICTHKKFVAGSAVTAFWNLTTFKTRFIAVFIIVVVIRYKQQNLHLDSEDKEEHQAQTQSELHESPDEKSSSPPRPTEEEQALVVVAETETPKKLS